MGASLPYEWGAVLRGWLLYGWGAEFTVWGGAGGGGGGGCRGGVTVWSSSVTVCRSPWSLGVCVVVLPAITQLLPSQREADHITVLAAVLEMIVTRFSPAILTCKSHVESCELRPLPDLQQMITCYTALHRAWVALGDRLESKGSNVIGQDSSDVVSVLSDVRSILTPFSTNLHLEHV